MFDYTPTRDPINYNPNYCPCCGEIGYRTLISNKYVKSGLIVKCLVCGIIQEYFYSLRERILFQINKN